MRFKTPFTFFSDRVSCFRRKRYSVYEDFMKTIKIAVLIIFCSFGALCAQGTKVTPETPEARATIEKMLTELEDLKDKPYDLSNRLWNFEVKALSFRNKGMVYNPETTRNISVRLIRVFRQLDNTDIGEANKERIISIIGVIDNSRESRDFFIDILENGSARTRKMALFSIWPRGVRGDEIYDKIQALVKKGKVGQAAALDPLKRANPERAIKDIQEYIRNTEDVGGFKGAGQLLSEYKRIDLMDVVLDRYEEMSEKWAGHFRDNPARAIKKGLLIQLAAAKEDAALKTVLEMLKKGSVGGEESLPIMEKKLRSSNKITREVVIDFLGDQVERGAIKAEKARPLLESAARNETEKALKEKATRMLKAIE